MKKAEILNINHCIICFYHNQWYKDDNSPQYTHKLIQTGELEMRERLYNKITKEVEYNEEFKDFCDFIFESYSYTKKHIVSNEQSDEDGNGEYDYITNAIPYYFEESKNSKGKEDMEIVHRVKKIIEGMNVNFERDLKPHCFTISFPEYMYKAKTSQIKDTTEHKNIDEEKLRKIKEYLKEAYITRVTLFHNPPSEKLIREINFWYKTEEEREKTIEQGKELFGEDYDVIQNIPFAVIIWLYEILKEYLIYHNDEGYFKDKTEPQEKYDWCMNPYREYYKNITTYGK